MTNKLKIEDKIQHCIFTERNIIDWNEYKNKILTNLSNNSFDIYNGNKLYIKKGKLREILHESIVLNNKIFKQ